MAISGVGKLVCLFMAFRVVAAPYADASTIRCLKVDSKLYSCLNYLCKGGSISSSCCKRVKSIYSEANTTIANRRATCRCLKSAYSSIFGINLSYASELPSACGVNVNDKNNTSTHCSKVK